MVTRQLEYLDALAREAHFGRAAEACHVSQPALSTGLKRLEAELGVRLIRRGRRFEGLTDEGEALLPWARSALASLAGITAEAAHLRGTLTGTLRIALIPAVAVRLGDLLGPFRAQQPAVRIGLSTGAAADIVARIAGHDLDAGFIYVDEALPPGLRAVELYRDRLVLLTSDANLAAGAHEATWAQASELPLCLLAPVMQNRQIIDRAFAAAGVVARPQVEADSVAALVELGLAGSSCIVADGWIHGRTLPPGVRVLGLVEPQVAPTVGLVTRAGPLEPPAARLLRESLAAQRLPG